MDSDVNVSVIMPVLNGMPYFSRALQSVCDQSMREIEVLVVDAGSTDGTVEFVNQQMEKDSRIHMLRSKEKSMGEQYNIGISNACGLYLAFCESDDYLDPDMIRSLFEVAQNNEYPDAVKSDFYMFFNKESEVSLHYHIFPKKQEQFYGKVISLNDYIELFNRDVNMWNGIYNRHFVLDRKIKLNSTKGAAFQDTGFVQQVNLLAEHQIYLPEPYYHYRRDNDGSSVYSKETSKFAIQECRFMMAWFDKHVEKKRLFGGVFLERIIGLFLELYGKNKYINEHIDFQEDVPKFRNEVIKFYEGLSHTVKTRLFQNDRLYAFFNQEFDMELQPIIHLKKEIEILKILRNELDRHNKVVIFGAGEIGQSMCVFLERNKYKGEILFCDNNPNLKGKSIFEHKVNSVEDTVKQYKDALYIVNPNMLYDTEYQLLQYGVHCDQIVVPLTISPHLSMELDMNVLLNEKEG